MWLKISIQSPREPIRQQRLDAPVLIVGRGLECDVVLTDAAVSRRHCRLICRPPHVWVEDLGSRNGTWVEGHRIRPFEPRPLSPGTVLIVGRVRLRVALENGEGEEETALEPVTSVPSPGVQLPSTSPNQTASLALHPVIWCNIRRSVLNTSTLSQIGGFIIMMIALILLVVVLFT